MVNVNTNGRGLKTIPGHHATNAFAEYGIALGDYKCRYQKLEQAGTFVGSYRVSRLARGTGIESQTINRDAFITIVTCDMLKRNTDPYKCRLHWSEFSLTWSTFTFGNVINFKLSIRTKFQFNLIENDIWNGLWLFSLVNRLLAWLNITKP